MREPGIEDRRFKLESRFLEIPKEFIMPETFVKSNGEIPIPIYILKKYNMREPGIEPGSHRWQRRILTTILPAHNSTYNQSFKNLITSNYQL